MTLSNGRQTGFRTQYLQSSLPHLSLSHRPLTWGGLQRVTGALAPPHRVEVCVVAVHPDVQLGGPAVVVDLRGQVVCHGPPLMTSQR